MEKTWSGVSEKSAEAKASAVEMKKSVFGISERDRCLLSVFAGISRADIFFCSEFHTSHPIKNRKDGIYDGYVMGAGNHVR